MKRVGVVIVAVLLLGLSVPMLEQTSRMPARSSTVYLTSAFTVTPSTWAYVGDTVTFFANATSDSGAATLNFTIYYDYLLANGSINPNSPVSVDTTENPGSINKTYVYNAPGNYTYTDGNQYAVRLIINDGMGGWRNITRYLTVVEDWAPEFNPPLPSVIDWEIGVPLNMSVTCWDNDDDSLTLMWNFGDGTDIATNLTSPALSGVVCNQTHMWNPDPEDLYGIGDTYVLYYLNLSLTDGWGHWTNTTTEIRLHLPHNFSPLIDSILVDGEWYAIVDPGDTVHISASASDQEGEPLTWTFVFNDGESDYRTEVFHTDATASNEPVWCNFTHVFGTVGRHYVTLNVSDALVPYQVPPHNVSLTVTVDVVVNSPPSVSATIGSTPSSPVIDTDIGYVEVSFMIGVLDMDGDVLTVTWDFGDGSPVVENVTEGGLSSHVVRQEHSYFDTGAYNVTVVVTDGRLGHEVARYLLVTITSDNLPPIFVTFSYTCRGLNPPFNYVGDLVRFSLVVTDPEQDPIEFTWDFGDGSPSVIETISEYVDGNARSSVNHTYLSPGWFLLTVTYTDNQEGVGEHTFSETEWMQIIEDEISPLADAGPDQVAFVGDVVTFDGSGSYDNWAISNYTWTFVYNGTEKTLWGVQPQFQFWTPGPYLVVLNVTDMVGNYNTSSMYVSVYEEIPEFGSAVSVAITMMLAFVAMAMIRRRKQ